MVTSKTLGKIALGLMFPCVGMGFYVQYTVKSKSSFEFKISVVVSLVFKSLY